MTKSVKEQCEELYAEAIVTYDALEKKQKFDEIAEILRIQGKASYHENVLCIVSPDGNGLTRPSFVQPVPTADPSILKELIQASRATGILGIPEMDSPTMPTAFNITTLSDVTSRPRYAVEYDENYRQVVAAVLVRSTNAEGEPVFLMLETNDNSAENEITNKVTLVQGHVNFDKPEHADMSFYDLIKSAANRELREEILIPEDVEVPELKISAFINNETDRINRCHVGFVFTVDLAYEDFKKLTSGEPEKHTLVEVDLKDVNNSLDPWAVLTLFLEERRIIDAEEAKRLEAEKSATGALPAAETQA